MDANPNLSPAITHQPSLLGGAENMKLLFDTTMALLQTQIADNQADSRAWNTLKLLQAGNSAVFSHAVNMNTVGSDQTGVTENQQAVTPIRTGVGDTVAASAYPANRAVDTSTATVAEAAAGIATANQALADTLAKVSELLAAVQTIASGVSAKTANVQSA